jgi:hypothetical protein
MEPQEVGSALKKEIDQLKEELVSAKKLCLEIMDSDKVATDLRKEIDGLKQDLTSEKDLNIKTKKEVLELKKDKVRLIPLLDIGVKVRRRNFEKMRAKLDEDAADESIIKAGNAAAPHPNVAADAVILQDWPRTGREKTDGEIFEKIYLLPPDHCRDWPIHPFVCRYLNCEAYENFIGPSNQMSASWASWNDCRDKVLAAFKQFRVDNLHNVMSGKLVELESLTEDLVTEHKEAHGRRHFWCKLCLLDLLSLSVIFTKRNC